MIAARLGRFRRYLPAAIGVLCLALLAWGTSRVLERLMAPRGASPLASAAPEKPSPTAHITATLFFATPDGAALIGARREVPLGEGIVAQGRQILLAQFAPPPSDYISVIPEGTMLRAFYVTERGDAFVDLSPEAAANHPGGSATELLTVYAIVNAVTTNLPTIQRVQILIDGKEAETLAGHVDLRRPLESNLALVANSVQ